MPSPTNAERVAALEDTVRRLRDRNESSIAVLRAMAAGLLAAAASEEQLVSSILADVDEET